MSDSTPNLQLPYIMAAQAQKHVTHNEAIRALDALVQLAVADRSVSSPPGNPSNGDCYIVHAGATGAWTGRENEVAALQDGAWMFYVPQEGWLAWVADEDALVAWDGAGWVSASGGPSSVNPTPLVGINATADTTNRLAVASPATLLNHDGNGHQLKINKAAAGDTGSVLFQSGFSGRAEFGLAGDDDWHVKVSPDGTTWHEAMVSDRNTGRVILPRGLDSLQVVIPRDAVALVQTPASGGYVMFMNVHSIYPQVQIAGLYIYDTGATPGLIAVHLAARTKNYNTTLPTGTYGVENEVGLAADALGNLHIENRLATNAAQQFSLVFFGGHRSI